jgi:hypothetical protein
MEALSALQPTQGGEWTHACATPYVHRKKAFRFSRPQPGCHLPNSPWAGIMTSYINYSRKGEFGK